MRLILHLFVNQKFHVISILFLGIVLNFLFTVADPLILKFLIDVGLVKRNFNLFWILSLTVITFGVFVRVGLLFQRLLSQKLRSIIVEKLTQRTLTAYYNIPYSEILKNDKGYFVSRIYDEPLANVDTESEETIMNIIFEYTKEKILMVTMHGNEKYYFRFDRIINLHNECYPNNVETFNSQENCNELYIHAQL